VRKGRGGGDKAERARPEQLKRPQQRGRRAGETRALKEEGKIEKQEETPEEDMISGEELSRV